ncbi:MAG: hypothetical protein KME03_12680 [Aphanocapsa lilacina HA4352-LM1]|nr:hypothetical protein [Aphanocapsa lilacina HA4352-LM1]
MLNGVDLMDGSRTLLAINREVAEQPADYRSLRQGGATDYFGVYDPWDDPYWGQVPTDTTDPRRSNRRSTYRAPRAAPGAHASSDNTQKCDRPTARAHPDDETHLQQWCQPDLTSGGGAVQALKQLPTIRTATSS